MGNRLYVALVVLFWLASMSWLVTAKVLPPLVGGQAPDYRASLSAAPQEPPTVVWRVIWDDEAIGFAATRVLPAPGGEAEMRSLVRFEQLDVRKILRQLLGAFAALMPSVGSDDLQLQMTVASRLRFDAEKTLRVLDASIAVADLPHVLNLHGDVQQGRTLDVVVFSGDEFRPSSSDGGDALLQHQVDLPRDALVGDAFAPHPDLRNLEVGQKWTMPVYRPFPPNSPVQIIEAEAERLEFIHWDREQVEAMVVVYRGEAGTGLAAREPIGRVWVRPDGVVLRQEALVSNLRLVFERMSSKEGDKYVHWLDDAEFLPLLPKAPTPAP